MKILPVRIIFQQHPTQQMSDHGLSAITDEEMHEEPDRLALDEDAERGDSGEQKRPLNIS